jgi:SSS family solute:Na+ symporter
MTLTFHTTSLAAISSIDWGVIVLYAIGMVVVGLYFSKKNNNTEDYLLGGRKMNPLMLGMSLFASLLSTISYLSYTGEMIRYGPMFITGAIAFPFVIFTVGSFMIPYFMKLRVTSAYEILEQRLGLSIRLLGSTLFTLIRLFWMAVIIHATTDKVLVPVLGLGESWTTQICILMGIVTITYTSLGGLRAVVFTDVIQSGILFGGGILTVAIITNELGNFRELWPAEWPTHWEKPNWGFDPEARMSLVSIFLAVFCWHTCTAGSDQVVIQRYFATRNVKAAKRVLVINLVADFLAMLLMAMVGLALIAYFTANPDILGTDQSLDNNSDQLFPKFISTELPVGLTGLVISGLLAAAMSSLSSGMNSTSSVITTDFISLFRSVEPDEKSKILIARWVSVIIGLIVVILSLIVGHVSGNLFEVANKVVNLFVSPLFVLFFLAMFVKSSNAIGVWCGALTSITIAVSIAFWKEITGEEGISFLWIMPAAFILGILVGSIASLAFRRKQES